MNNEDIRNVILLLILISSGEADARDNIVKPQNQVFESIEKMINEL